MPKLDQRIAVNDPANRNRRFSTFNCQWDNLQEVHAKARQIKDKAEILLEEAKKLTMWLSEQEQPLNIMNVIQEAIPSAIPPDVKLIRRSYGEIPSVCAGHLQLVEVFRNLIQNAIDAMPESLAKKW